MPLQSPSLGEGHADLSIPNGRRRWHKTCRAATAKTRCSPGGPPRGSSMRSSPASPRKCVERVRLPRNLRRLDSVCALSPPRVAVSQVGRARGGTEPEGRC